MRSLILLTIVAASLGSAAFCPLSGVNDQIYSQAQEFGSTFGTFNWWLSPCSASVPAGQKTCAGQPTSAYFAQFDVPTANDGACQFIMDKQSATGWVKGGSTASSIFYSSDFSSSVNGNTATVTIMCEPSGLSNLEGSGNVIAKAIQGGYNYAAVLKSNACGGAETPAPPTPAGQTTPAPAGSGSSNASNSGSGSGNNANTLVNCTVNGVKHVNVTVADCEAYAAPPPPKKEAGGCGGGCIFLILFFVGGFLYVVGAVAWNFKGGKRGKELAPHPEFWGEVPGLIKDGAIFFAAGVCALVDKCRGKGGSSNGEGGYSSV